MYTLRVPFQLASTQQINDLDEPATWNHNGLVFELMYDEPYHVLTVKGFPTESAARDYMLEVQSGLLWLLLNRGFAFEAEWKLDEVIVSPDPDAAARNILGEGATGPVHGIVSGNVPAVYPSDQRILKATGYPARVISGHTVNLFQQFVHEGMEIRSHAPIKAESRLWTALDLYNAYYFERSNNARLLTLIMALEALSESHDKHKAAQELISQWQTQITTKKNELATESKGENEALASLDALERELLFRRESSLRSQIRTFVRKTLERAGNPDATEISRRALKVYDERSTLSHEGTLPPKRLADAVAEAKEIVEIVLQACYRFGER